MNTVKDALEARARQYQALLASGGYQADDPAWDEENRCWGVQVRFAGAVCFMVLDVDDPRFIRILLPNFLTVGPGQLGASLIAADLANKTCKGAKICLNRQRDDVLAAVELLEPAAGLEEAAVVRSMQMLLHAAKTYAGQFSEQANIAH